MVFATFSWYAFHDNCHAECWADVFLFSLTDADDLYGILASQNAMVSQLQQQYQQQSHLIPGPGILQFKELLEKS